MTKVLQPIVTESQLTCREFWETDALYIYVLLHRRTQRETSSCNYAKLKSLKET